MGLLRAQQARLSAHAKLKGALSGKAEADGSYLAALQVQVESALQGNAAVIIGLATASGAIAQLSVGVRTAIRYTAGVTAAITAAFSDAMAATPRLTSPQLCYTLRVGHSGLHTVDRLPLTYTLNSAQ